LIEMKHNEMSGKADTEGNRVLASRPLLATTGKWGDFPGGAKKIRTILRGEFENREGDGRPSSCTA
jgi:hypothetical protein